MNSRQFGPWSIGLTAAGVLVLVAAALGSASAAHAQASAEVASCRAISDNRLRLECYDAIPVRAPVAGARKYEIVPMADFKLDRSNLRRRHVAVRGVGRIDGDLLLLTEDEYDADPIKVDLTNLSRADRLIVLETCRESCAAIVQGLVTNVQFQTGILAERILFD